MSRRGVRLQAASAPVLLLSAVPRGARAVAGAEADGLFMLSRRSTRIELKPEDREEYFAHKQEKEKPASEQVEEKKPSEKDVRIGLAKTR